MAYGNYLAAVSEAQVVDWRENPSITFAPRLLVAVNHLAAYWVKAQPLGTLLSEAIDGGSVVSERLWHPLRAPMLHGVDGTRALFEQLGEAWSAASHGLTPTDAAFQADIEGVLRVFKVAAAEGLCVLSVLEAPMDEARARRVQVPFLD